VLNFTHPALSSAGVRASIASRPATLAYAAGAEALPYKNGAFSIIPPRSKRVLSPLSLCLSEHADEFGDYDCSRSGNPTRTVLEEQLARLEGGARGFVFASGMAAITAVARTLCTGDEILADSDLYGGTCRLFTRILKRSGIHANYSDASKLASLAAKITPRTRLIFLESPTNPLLRVIDLQALATLAHDSNALLVVDNSLMSPYLQLPLSLGAYIVVHSACCPHLCISSYTLHRCEISRLRNDATALEFRYQRTT
jgi:cystathionine beta-lyase/cystathionine gamma-synthase